MPDYPSALIRDLRYKLGESPSVRDWIPRDPSTGFDLPTGVKVVDGAITSSDTLFTSVTADFTSDNVGDLMVVRGAGSSGAYLRTTIATFVSAGSVRLTAAAGTTVTGAMAAFGPDSLTAFQSAVDSGYALIPRGIYLVSGTISHDERLHITGRSRGSCRLDSSGNVSADADGVGVEIWSTSTNPVFEFLSSLRDAAYDINCALSFANIAIYAKRPIKLNQERSGLPALKYQGRLLHSAFSNIEFHGEYGSAMDANWDTASEPTWDAMIAYGCGIEAHQCFGLTTDEYCIIQQTGIGVYLRDSDECIIKEARITQNGHQVGIRGTIASGYGNKNRVVSATLGGNHRVGAVRTEQTTGTLIGVGCYFECYTFACRFVWSVSDIDHKWLDCSAENPNNPSISPVFPVTTPICKYDSWHSIIISRNGIGSNGSAIPPMSFAYTYWAGSFNINQYFVFANSSHWPTPGMSDPSDGGTVQPIIGGVMTELLNQYRFHATNIPNNTLAGATTFPFEVNATTGRWMTIKTGSPSVLGIQFPLQSQLNRRFAFRFTLRNAIGGASSCGAVLIKYIGAGTTTLINQFLEPTSTTKVDIRQVYLTIPGAEITNGYFLCEIDTQTAEWEEILLIPIDDYNLITPDAVPRVDSRGVLTEATGITARGDAKAGLTITSTEDGDQPGIPDIKIIDNSRSYGAETGPFAIFLKTLTTKRLYMGLDTSIGSAGAAFIQAIYSGVGALILALNPVGGRILMRTATDDGSNDIQMAGNTKITGALKSTGNRIFESGYTRFPDLNASRNARFDADKGLIDGPIDIGLATDISATGFSTNDVAMWDGSKLVPAPGITDTITVVIAVSIASTENFLKSGGGAALGATSLGVTTLSMTFTKGRYTS